MKLFISTDIEGICDVTVWDQTRVGQSLYPPAAKQMTLEVNAACVSAKEAGVKEIVVKDSHGPALNIDPDGLIEEVTLIRGWSGTPEYMVYGLDETFDAIAFIGYHAAGALQGNPLAHTSNASKIFKATLNGDFFSELTLGMYTAAYFGVPSVFVSGDKTLCKQAQELLPGIGTISVKDGLGAATINMSPKKAISQIECGIKDILKTDYTKLIPNLPSSFELDITYEKPYDAVRTSYFPGAKLLCDYTVRFTADDFYEVMRFFLFAN